MDRILDPSSESAAPANSAAHEAETLARIAARDRMAFRSLYLAYYSRLYRFVLRIVQRPELAEEVVDDVMLAVWRKAASFRGEAVVSTWLFGIAYRQALKSLRRRPREQALDSVAEPGDLQPGPEEAADRGLVHRRIRLALAELSAEHRAVVELTYFLGYSCREVARIVDCPVNTVKTRLFHARLRLREQLAETSTEVES